MRISEALRRHLDGVTRVVYLDIADLDLNPYISLPERVEFQHLGAHEVPDKIDVGTLIFALVGPDTRRHGNLDEFIDMMPRFATGGRGVLLFGFTTAALPFHRLLDPLTANSCQILEFMPLNYSYIHSAMAIERVEEVCPPSYLNLGVLPDEADSEAQRFANQLRLVNEYQCADVLNRNLRAQVADRNLRHRSPEASESSFENIRQLKIEQKLLRDSLARAERQLRTVEASTTFRVGKLVTDAMRRPGREAVRAPAELFRLWKERRTGRSGDNRSVATDPVSAEWVSEADERLLSRYVATEIVADDRLAVCGVWTSATHSACAPSCAATRLFPDDALLLFERSEPDFVLIETAAFRAGSPWAFVGTPAGLRSTVVLQQLVERAGEREIPVVIWRNTPAYEAPELSLLGQHGHVAFAGSHRSDLDFGRGVQLSRFHPIALDRERERPPALVWRGSLPPMPLWPVWRDVVATAVGAGLESVVTDLVPGPRGADDPLGLGAMARVIPSERLGDFYRGRAVVLDIAVDADVRDRVLEQVLCGARVIAGPGSSPGLSEERAVAVAHDAPSVRALLDEWNGEPPLDQSVIRPLLRRAFLEHAVPIRLDALAEAVGARRRATRGREVAVVARVSDSTDVAGLAGSLRRQVVSPAEVVVAVGSDVAVSNCARALADLETFAGTSIHVEKVDQTDAALLSRLASGTTVPWVSFWDADGEYSPFHLIDLLAGAECSGADVVGFGAPPFEFTNALSTSGLLVRRVLSDHEEIRATSGGRASWSRAGYRAFSVGEMSL